MLAVPAIWQSSSSATGLVTAFYEIRCGDVLEGEAGSFRGPGLIREYAHRRPIAGLVSCKDATCHLDKVLAGESKVRI